MSIFVDWFQLNIRNNNFLTAAFSIASLEIRSRNEEATNSTRNRIYLLKVFYFLLYRRRYFFDRFCKKSPKRTDIQLVENLSSICPVPCGRRLHLNLVPGNFLFQKFTVLSIFRQNALRSLIAVKHSILSKSNDVKSDSAA